MKILTNNIAVLARDSHISSWIEQEGRLCHDKCVGLFILPLIPVGGTVVDGGAFIGDHTIAYLEKVGPTGRVLAFEPNPDAMECLQHNCPRAEFHLYALGRTYERSKLEIHENAGASRLAPIGTADVFVMPLDAIKFDRLDFIKLDLEGSEVAALQGAAKTIAQHRPVMVIEMCDGHLQRQGSSAEELQTLLTSWGYRYRSLNPGLNMDEPQLDLLCEPEKK